MGLRWRRWALAAALAAFAALRVHSAYHTAFNWDEFALFHDVARSAAEGTLVSSGHAGLPQAALLPLVRDCTDEIAVGRAARLVWLAFTAGYLAGVFALLRELLPDDRHRLHDAALGTALLGLLPAFLEWSLQVRTDQVALCAGTWGAVALVASRRRAWLALPAGLAFGVGWLATQKLAYVVGLGVLLAAGDLFVRGAWRTRRELARGAAALLGAGSVVLAWRAWVTAAFRVASAHAAVAGVSPEAVHNYLDVFAFYRATIGYSQYLATWPTLAPHALLLAAALAAAALCRVCRTRRFGLAGAVLAAGVAVGAFHGAAFAYFLMTLGLFAAVGLALTLPSLRTALADRWPEAAKLATPVVWAALALAAGLHQIAALEDSQSVQRESLGFVHRNFAPERAGFQPETALFCGVRQPLGLWFSQRIYQTFEGPGREKAIEKLLRRFRNEPVHYLVQSFRLNQFPTPVRRFWDAHYQPYRDSVFVAGSRLAGDADDRVELDLLVEAPYRWLPVGPHPQPIRLEGRSVAPGEVVFLTAGRHEAVLEADGVRGVLVLAVDEPPGTAPLAFYKRY
jgi:hypothetical protein